MISSISFIKLQRSRPSVSEPIIQKSQKSNRRKSQPVHANNLQLPAEGKSISRRGKVEKYCFSIIVCSTMFININSMNRYKLN